MAKKAPEAFVYNAILERIVDGDTFDCCLDLGFDVKLHKQRVRLSGIDTPESRTRDLEEKFYGKQSKYFLESLLKDQKIQLVSHDKGKFGRILGELFIDGLETSVNQTMINNNHAVPYYGGNKDETERHHLENRKALNEQGIVYEAK